MRSLAQNLPTIYIIILLPEKFYECERERGRERIKISDMYPKSRVRVAKNTHAHTWQICDEKHDDSLTIIETGNIRRGSPSSSSESNPFMILVLMGTIAVGGFYGYKKCSTFPVSVRLKPACRPA